MAVTPPLRYNSKIAEGLLRGVDATITMGDKDMSGLVQEWQVSYDRPVERQYDLIAGGVSYLEGKPQGSLVLSGVVSRSTLYSQACSTELQTIVLTPGSTYCEGGPPPIFTFTDCLPMKFTMRGALNSSLVLFNVAYTFINMRDSTWPLT